MLAIKEFGVVDDADCVLDAGRGKVVSIGETNVDLVSRIGSHEGRVTGLVCEPFKFRETEKRPWLNVQIKGLLLGTGIVDDACVGQRMFAKLLYIEILNRSGLIKRNDRNTSIISRIVKRNFNLSTNDNVALIDFVKSRPADNSSSAGRIIRVIDRVEAKNDLVTTGIRIDRVRDKDAFIGEFGPHDETSRKGIRANTIIFTTVKHLFDALRIIAFPVFAGGAIAAKGLFAIVALHCATVGHDFF